MLRNVYELSESELEEVESGFTTDNHNYIYEVGLTEISDVNWRDHPWRRCEFDRNTSWGVFKYYIAMPVQQRSVKKAYAHYLISERGESPDTAFKKGVSSAVYNDSKAKTDEGQDLRDYGYITWPERANAWDKFKNTLETEHTVAKRRHVVVQEFDQIETLRRYWFELLDKSMRSFDNSVKIAAHEGKEIAQTTIDKHVMRAKRLAETHSIFTKDQRGSVQMPSTYTHTQTNESPDEIFKWEEPEAGEESDLEEMIERLKIAARSNNIEEYKNAKEEYEDEEASGASD